MNDGARLDQGESMSSCPTSGTRQSTDAAGGRPRLGSSCSLLSAAASAAAAGCDGASNAPLAEPAARPCAGRRRRPCAAGRACAWPAAGRPAPRWHRWPGARACGGGRACAAAGLPPWQAQRPQPALPRARAPARQPAQTCPWPPQRSRAAAGARALAPLAGRRGLRRAEQRCQPCAAVQKLLGAGPRGRFGSSVVPMKFGLDTGYTVRAPQVAHIAESFKSPRMMRLQVTEFQCTEQCQLSSVGSSSGSWQGRRGARRPVLRRTLAALRLTVGQEHVLRCSASSVSSGSPAHPVQEDAPGWMHSKPGSGFKAAPCCAHIELQSSVQSAWALWVTPGAH